MKITVLLSRNAAHPLLAQHEANPVAAARAAGLSRWLDRAQWVCVVDVEEAQLEALEADPAVVVWS